LAKQIIAWQVQRERQQRRQRLGQQERQRRQQQERLVQQQEQRLQRQERQQEQRLLLFCRKRSKQRRPTKRRTKRIWSW
jgi:hypothetical protein